jgi:cytochrome b involved in lipid metabolism
MRRQLLLFIPIIIILTLTATFLFAQRVSENTNEPAAPPISLREITSAQLAERNTPSNCWTIITASVYNLTPYFDRSPNPGLAAAVCGKDGTEQLKSIAAAQSKALQEVFDIYRIGILVP